MSEPQIDTHDTLINTSPEKHNTIPMGIQNCTHNTHLCRAWALARSAARNLTATKFDKAAKQSLAFFRFRFDECFHFLRDSQILFSVAHFRSAQEWNSLSNATTRQRNAKITIIFTIKLHKITYSSSSSGNIKRLLKARNMH